MPVRPTIAGMKIRLGFAVVTVATALTACTSTPAPRPEPVVLPWQEITLPAAPDGERNTLGDGAYCDGHWYLVGAYAHEEDTRPAAWTSLDGSSWTTQPVFADSYYGVRSLLHAAACEDGHLVALGGKIGGAHGNPRMSSYHLVDGVLTEVAASFELYGGPHATNVGRMTAGPAGFLIVGNRSAGAAVWRSPDGAAFEIVEGAPGLASTSTVFTWAADAAYHDGAWVVVGSTGTTTRPGRDAAAWRSTDGLTWRAMPVQAAPGYDELSVVAQANGTLVALGPHDDAFQAWRLDPAQGWRLAGQFGSRVLPTADQLSAAIPVDVVAAGGVLMALVKADNLFQLWRSTDTGASWQVVTAPAGVLPAAGGQTAALVAAAPDRIMLLADDGARARAWIVSVDG